MRDTKSEKYGTISFIQRLSVVALISTVKLTLTHKKSSTTQAMIAAVIILSLAMLVYMYPDND